MASSAYGRKLNPYRRLRESLGIKGVRQWVVKTHNPSTIDENDILTILFPNLAENDVIVPGTARLAFQISLTSTDDKRSIVQNLGRALVKKITIKLDGNEVMSIDNCDVYHCYMDLWKTAQERQNLQYQGIDTSRNQNVTKLRLKATDGVERAADKAIAKAYQNRYYIPLDFEMLESHMPFCQSALGSRLEYELIFNDYKHVIKATGDADAKYKIEKLSLEFEKVTSNELGRMAREQYASRAVIYYDRVLRDSMVRRDKSDHGWTINIQKPARSIKGILMLFQEPAEAFQKNTEEFYNPKITKVTVTIEGLTNQLYNDGLSAYQQWDETRKFFAAGCKRDPEVAIVAKDLALADVSLGEYLTSKYALWLDLRSTDDEKLHGSGRRLENVNDGVSVSIAKEQEGEGTLDVYVYLVMDAQINIENGRFIRAVY